MFIKSTLTLATLVLAKSVAAQNATAQEINAAVANFQGAGIVPSLLPTFNPQGVLEVAFNGTQINLGDALPQDTVGAFPNIQINPYTGSSAWGFGANYTYTAMMVDADIVGTDQSGTQTFHWLANGLTLGDSSTDPPFSLNLSTATTIINYAGPGPASGSGPHRYVIVLLPQYSNFTAPSALSAPNTPLGVHSTSGYLSTTGLGPVVAASYYTVENGVATVSVASTTPVDLATVATVLGNAGSSSAASSAASVSATGASSSSAASGTASRSVTGAASSAPAATSSGAAGKAASLAIGGHWIAVGITLLGAVGGALMI